MQPGSFLDPFKRDRSPGNALAVCQVVQHLGLHACTSGQGCQAEVGGRDDRIDVPHCAQADDSSAAVTVDRYLVRARSAQNHRATGLERTDKPFDDPFDGGGVLLGFESAEEEQDRSVCPSPSVARSLARACYGIAGCDPHCVVDDCQLLGEDRCVVLQVPRLHLTDGNGSPAPVGSPPFETNQTDASAGLEVGGSRR